MGREDMLFMEDGMDRILMRSVEGEVPVQDVLDDTDQDIDDGDNDNGSDPTN